MDAGEKITNASTHIMEALKAFTATEQSALYIAFVPPKADATTHMTVVGMGDHPVHAVNGCWGILSTALAAYDCDDERCECECCARAVELARQCIAILERRRSGRCPS